MDQSTQRRAVFTGLVYDEEGKPVETTFVGQEPHYIIMDGDFKRHVAAEVDRQVTPGCKNKPRLTRRTVTQGMMGHAGQG
jgi:hypothetical protein